jgi:hypothetical protein
MREDGLIRPPRARASRPDFVRGELFRQRQAHGVERTHRRGVDDFQTTQTGRGFTRRRQGRCEAGLTFPSPLSLTSIQPLKDDVRLRHRRHCEERSDEAIHAEGRPTFNGLLRFARNDASERTGGALALTRIPALLSAATTASASRLIPSRPNPAIRQADLPLLPLVGKIENHGEGNDA